MVLDGQCSCSGVITVSGKGHGTNNRHQLSKGLFSFLFKQLSAQERRTALNYCIPCIWTNDRLYQLIDRNCSMQNNTASPSCHQRAAHRVSTKHKSITVASNLIVSNIFFSCFTCPIKKHVLRQQYFQRYKALQKALCLQGDTAIQFQGWRRWCHWRNIWQTTSAWCWN